MNQINYDIFWKLSFFLDIKSIKNLSDTCRNLKFFQQEMKPILIKRMFPDNSLLQEPFLLLYKFYIWNHFQQSTFLERIIIFIINESTRLKKNVANQLPNSEIKFEHEIKKSLFKLFNKILMRENINACNLSYIFIHGTVRYKKLLIEKIFNSKVIICNFNLQHLFNAIITLQDLYYLDQFYLHFKDAHIMITREHIRKIIISKNSIFFDRLVTLFIGDYIKFNLYQSSIKEYVQDSNSPFAKYICKDATIIN